MDIPGSKPVTFNNHRVAILATELTEAALIEALQAKRFYSTSDMNIGLSFTIEELSRVDNSAPDNDEVTVQATPTGSPSSLFVRIRADLQTP